MHSGGMTGCARLARIALTVLLVAAAAGCSRDPRATRLPLNPQDIAKLQAPLGKLPAEERQLVLDYLARSKGSVLPPHLADPDLPLTARTFGEAITLQRDFRAKHAAELARVDALKADREAGLEPLRQALAIELVKREILTHDQASGRQPGAGQAINASPVLVTTYRLRNTSSETITQFSGSVSLRGLSDCFLSRDETIAPGATLELRCANLAMRAGPAEQQYVAMPADALVLRWEPRFVTFASGKMLRAE